jgi:hypothetical protein
MASLHALETEEGRLRLTLHEDIGRFSLHYLADLQNERYEPLLYERDPRTTMLSIFADNSVFRMGESPQFSLEVTENEIGPAFVWTSGLLRIRQQFEIIRAEDARLANGVEITLTITNAAERELRVGAAYVLDTALGEEEEVHFRTPEQESYSQETRLTPSSDLSYWVSPAPSFPNVGLQFALRGRNITEPSEVIFANWKRLSQRPWSYEVNPARNFNLLPYSINDSAAAVYYERRALAPGASREIVSRLGNYTESGFATPVQQTTAEAQLLEESSQPSEGEASGSDRDDTYQDLVRVNDILAEIDKLLEQESEPSEESLDVIDKALESLQGRYQSE